MRLLLILIQLTTLILCAPAVFAQPKSNTEKLSWAELNETCIIYDYRPMIEAGEPTDLYFAIEPQNHNGGSIEKLYSKKDFKNAKSAYKAMLKGLIHFSDKNRCDDFRFFYPSKANPESPM